MRSKIRALVFVLVACVLLSRFGGGAALNARALGSFDPLRVRYHQVAGGLNKPILVTDAGDGSGRLFIVEQPGFIRILKNGAVLSTPFLDIHSDVRYADGGEQGLLTLAFHPSYSSNGEFFVAYTAPRDNDLSGSVLTLKRFTVSGNPDLADATSGVVILTIDHPTNSNHNGGTLAFGPDGYLYWSTGDGGSGGDPPNNAQNLNVLLGKILRLDVDHTDTGLQYAIPSSNPFVGVDGLDEIWAYGLRNPWRMSFDRQTGDLWIGDVGQNGWEEVDFQPASSAGGENYGWKLYEGNHCYSGACDPTGLTFPVLEYDSSTGCHAVTGGYVYRGSHFSAMQGRYFYGDYCTGEIFSYSGGTVTPIADTPYNISSFGEDGQGELYFADLGGRIFQMCYIEAAVRADFGGDCATDPSVYRPSTGIWYMQGLPNANWGGIPGDIPIPGDYNGDGNVDVAIYRPSEGKWYVRNQFSTLWGIPGDIPVPGDYNGDGITDLAIFRPSDGKWYVRNQLNIAWGIAGDIPVPADYNGDGVTDLAVVRPSDHKWYIRNVSTVSWHVAGDIPVPGDYNGDGSADIAVYRPSDGKWYVRNQFNTPWGIPGDIPVAGDYSADTVTDLAVFRPSDGKWYVKNVFNVAWGMIGDWPLPAPDTNGDGDPYQ